MGPGGFHGSKHPHDSCFLDTLLTRRSTPRKKSSNTWKSGLRDTDRRLLSPAAYVLVSCGLAGTNPVENEKLGRSLSIWHVLSA